jgi:hypothetical protein
MTEIVREASGVVAIIRKLEPASVAKQHMRMHREWQLRSATSALDHSQEPCSG